MKKPRFKPRVGCAETVDHDGYSGWYAQPCKDWADQSKATLHRVRVTDARDMTAEQAVQKVFNNLSDLSVVTNEGLNRLLAGIPMTAEVGEYGKVKVRRIKE